MDPGLSPKRWCFAPGVQLGNHSRVGTAARASLLPSEFPGAVLRGVCRGSGTCRGGHPGGCEGKPQKRHVVRSKSWLWAPQAEPPSWEGPEPGGQPLRPTPTSHPGEGSAQGGEGPSWVLWAPAQGGRGGCVGGQCRLCLTQFRMAHFCPEQRCITSRSPKLASFDISTSRHLPVSRLTMGPLCRAGTPSQHTHPQPP